MTLIRKSDSVNNDDPAASPLVVEPHPVLPGERGDGRSRPGPPPAQPWPGPCDGEHSAGPRLLEAPGPGERRGRGQRQHRDRVVVDLVAAVTGQALVMFSLPDDVVYTLHAGLQPLDGGGGDSVVLVAAAGPGVNRLVIALIQSIVTKTELLGDAEDGAQRAGATDLRTGSHGRAALVTRLTEVTVVSLCSAELTSASVSESLVP